MNVVIILLLGKKPVQKTLCREQYHVDFVSFIETEAHTSFIQILLHDNILSIVKIHKFFGYDKLLLSVY